MFRNLSSTLAAANATGNKAEGKKTMSPSLRPDIYSTMDKVKSWIIGGIGGGQAGDGVSFGPIVSTIQKHFPDTKVGLDSIGTDAEVAVIVGGVTNMILEMSKWDGMAGGIAMRTWVDALEESYRKVPGPNGRKESVARGITRGINQMSDVQLMTREFAARIQIISLLKTVNTRIYGAGTEEARQGEALWSSKFI